MSFKINNIFLCFDTCLHFLCPNMYFVMSLVWLTLLMMVSVRQPCLLNMKVIRIHFDSLMSLLQLLNHRSKWSMNLREILFHKALRVVV